MSWWVNFGYLPFEEGKGGFPRTEQVVKHYRGQTMDNKGKPWAQSRLAKASGLETNQTIWNLENLDTELEFERRQFLCRLFDIPPVLLGILSLDEINKIVGQRGKASTISPIVSTPLATSHKLFIDVEEYASLLNGYWKTFLRNPTQVSMINIDLCINALYRELPYTKEKKPIQELLCRFHDLAANMQLDWQKYDDALIHLEKAWRFVQLLKSDELKVFVLYDSGYVLELAGHLDKALEKYEQARRYEQRVPRNLWGSLLLSAGSTGALAAETSEKKEVAIRLIDRVGNILRNNEIEEDPYFLNFNLDRYHVKRSEALITVGRNNDALNELKLAEFGSEHPHRQAYHNILQAQVQINLSEYSEAAHLAASGLVVAHEIGSEVNIARVEHIYEQFPQDLFKHDSDVARLEYLLHYKHRSQ